MEPDLEFLSSLFPNLSTQLRIVLQNLQVAAARLAPAEAREQDPKLDQEAALLDRSYYQLLRLCTDLTATAWLSQKKKAHLKNIDLVDLVQQIFASASSLAELKGLELHLVCPERRHLLAGDRAGLELLIYHLLSNAFKFTPVGGVITIEVKSVPDYQQIIVTDTGCGISPEQLPALFSRSIVAEDLTALPPHGLGLGLMLCRAIAEAHSGSMLASSRVGKGSRFILSLPDRLIECTGLSDVPFDYTGGFNTALMHLSDALPAEAFHIRNK